MNNIQIRWENFRGFEDTGWVSIKPLTIIIGPNNSGKSSLLAPLLAMKQTIDLADSETPLMSKGPYVDLGTYKDFVHKHDASLDVSFFVKLPYYEKWGSRKKRSEKNEIGDVPPSYFSVTFNYAKERYPFDYQLQKFEIFDLLMRKMVSRVRTSIGNYSLRFFGDGNIDPSRRRLIVEDPPLNFAFTDSPMRFILRKQVEVHRRKDDKKRDAGMRLNVGETLYFATVSNVFNQILSFFDEISYVGPIRAKVGRLYEYLGKNPESVGVLGEQAPEILARKLNKAQLEQIDFWTRTFDFGGVVRPREGKESGSFYLSLLKKGKKNSENLADSGSGLSQLLPLIVQAVHTQDDALIISEQPEIHLNPKLQAKLADLLVEVANSSKSIVVETHSEHLLLRLRRLIAEGKIDSENVSIIFVEKENSLSKVREIPVLKNGHINEDDWPKGFFEGSLKESINLALAQSRGKMSGK